MALVRHIRSSIPADLSPENEAIHRGMTAEQIERNAQGDAENPPMTDEELSRALIARRIKRQREKMGLSQAKFAERYHIKPSRLRDWEQGRFMPDSVALAYLTVIEKNPDAVFEALREEAVV
jgi:putative transcriptional regulator